MDTYTRNFLRKRSHELTPIVMIGKSGMSVNIEHALDEALAVHELVKVKFLNLKDEKKEVARMLAEHTKAELVTVVGNIAIIYRKHEDPAMRRYNIPKRH